MNPVENLAAAIPGDIAYFMGGELESRAIIAAERELRPAGFTDPFCPSHALMIGPGPKQVTEAALTAQVSSCAAVNPIGEYAGQEARLRIYRPGGSADLKAAALARIIRGYGPMRYGILNLLGFEDELLKEKIFGEPEDNPIMDHLVCSQTQARYIQWLSTEPWIWGVYLPDASPDVMYRANLANLGAAQ